MSSKNKIDHPSFIFCLIPWYIIPPIDKNKKIGFYLFYLLVEKVQNEYENI